MFKTIFFVDVFIFDCYLNLSMKSRIVNSSNKKMSDQQPDKKQENQDTDTTPTSSGGYQTTIDETTRKTGVASAGNAKDTAMPEAPENDSVVGSPNQGTESR